MRREPPVTILETKEDLATALEAPTWTDADKYRVKSLWLCQLIEAVLLERRHRFCYNDEVWKRAREELGLPPADYYNLQGHYPLATLVYNAQGYVDDDFEQREGYEPFTEELILRAYEAGANIQFKSGTVGTVRKLGDQICCVPRRARKRRFIPNDTTPARLV